MIETLKTVFYREKEILESEAAIANKKHRETALKVEELKKDFEAKSVRSISLAKKEKEYLASLIQDGAPQCPRCIVRSNDFHDMSPQSGNDKFEYFSCETCGLEIEIKI